MLSWIQVVKKQRTQAKNNDICVIFSTFLIDTYLQLNTFINRYLPDKFYLEGDQRIDLREKIFREVIGNIICHREYTDGTATELIIEEDAVRTLNPNNPWFNGVMDLETFSPHPKNPNIRRFFNVLGWTDEIGSGIRNTKKYLPLYVENAKPVFIDAPLFCTIIPLVRYTMSDFTNEWFNWLELDEKWRPKLVESLKNIEVDGELHKMTWEKQVSCLAPSWIEKGTKYHFIKSSINQTNSIKEALGQKEKGTKSLPKKLHYIVVTLLILGTPLSIDELMDIFDYRDRGKFRQNYIKPLETVGFISKTIPDKPNAPNQKYLITEQGKQFLTGSNS
jgi:ATP-dependent DNA helicase RecG